MNMASNDEESSTNVVKDQLEVPSAQGKVKHKKSIPIRIIEEEVWFSGSELKTDNSSSDEDQVYTAKSAMESQMIKGAKKKTTKFVSKSKKIITKHTSTESVSESRIKIEESISSDSENEIFYDTGGHGDTDEGKITISQQNTVGLDIEQIKILRERIKRAEEEYVKSCKQTDNLVSDMCYMLDELSYSKIENPELIFFVNITKKLIKCLAGTGLRLQNIQTKKIFGNSKDYINSIQKQSLATYNARKRNRILRDFIINRKYSKYPKSILLKNIEQSSKSKLKNTIEMTKIKQSQNKKINNILTGWEKLSESMGEDESFPYKFTVEELKRLEIIEKSLELYKLQHSNNEIYSGYEGELTSKCNKDNLELTVD